MRMDESRYSIAEIIEMLGRKDLVANKEYQRGSGIWPTGPRSYFIDTVLSGFPFPKIYFFEYLDKSSRKTRRELVDGQQRISSIVSYVEDKFALNQFAIRAALEELSLWVSQRGSIHIHENVMGALTTLDIHTDAISSAIERLRT